MKFRLWGFILKLTTLYKYKSVSITSSLCNDCLEHVALFGNHTPKYHDLGKVRGLKSVQINQKFHSYIRQFISKQSKIEPTKYCRYTKKVFKLFGLVVYKRESVTDYIILKQKFLTSNMNLLTLFQRFVCTVKDTKEILLRNYVRPALMF